MKHRLQQTQSQRLMLLPQMKLNLKILEMPILELKQRIDDELNQNPAIEEEPGTLSDSEPSTPSEPAEKSVDAWQEDSDSYNDEPEESLVDSRELARRKNYQESLIRQELTLADQLHAELNLLNLNDEERVWADELIGSLDENGFLNEGLSELAVRLSVPDYELEALLKKLQASLEPPGILARNLEECLALQLERRDDSEAKLALDIVKFNFTLLQKKAFDQLMRIYKVPVEKIQHALTLIQHLDPKPGKAFVPSRPMEVVPDIVITAHRDNPKKFLVEVQDSWIPRLRIVSDYKKMVKNEALEAKAKKFIKENLTNALWLMEALDYRKTTLALIVKKILDHQSEFLEKGFAHLRPLRMKDIALELSIHESTVSRAIAGKFMETPLGTYPIRAFFSGKVTSSSSEAESQKSVLAKIKRLIEAEDPKKPLSDQKIVALLKEENIQIARRTVAKYRDLLKILPTNLRKKR